MKRFVSNLVIALLLSATFLSAPAKAGDSASAVVKTFYASLEEAMKQGETLGFEGRYKKLEPAVTQAFNLPLMARYSVGPAWAKASKEDQERLVKAFSDFSIATYASRFKKYDGERFAVLRERSMTGKDGSVMVETNLTPKDEAPVILNYLLRPDEKGNLRIVDVYLDASISELATRRAEFSSVIKREGFAALLSSLNEKVKKMGLDKTGQ